MNVWECDMVDVQALGKFNHYYKHIITVIDVFSKFLHLVPMNSKRGTAVPLAFQSTFDDHRRRSVWVRTDKAKGFLNKYFQEMLKR